MTVMSIFYLLRLLQVCRETNFASAQNVSKSAELTLLHSRLFATWNVYKGVSLVFFIQIWIILMVFTDCIEVLYSPIYVKVIHPVLKSAFWGGIYTFEWYMKVSWIFLKDLSCKMFDTAYLLFDISCRSSCLHRRYFYNFQINKGN